MAIGSKSNWLENAVLNFVLGKSADLTFLSGKCYIALCATEPTDVNTGADLDEPTVGEWSNYTRKQIAAADWNAASGGSITTNAIETFVGFASGSGFTAVGFALCDSPTPGAGNVLYWGATTSKLINAQNTPASISAGGITINEA